MMMGMAKIKRVIANTVRLRGTCRATKVTIY